MTLRMSAQPTIARAATRSGRLGRPVLASWTDEVATEEPLAFFARGADVPDRTYWERPEEGRAVVGLGVALAFEPAGPSRFAELGVAWRTVLADGVVCLPSEAPPGSGPEPDRWARLRSVVGGVDGARHAVAVGRDPLLASGPPPPPARRPGR